MPAPHEDAKYWQADAVAECLAVTKATYAELWNKIVPLYDAEPRGEVPGEYTYPIVDYWHLLSGFAQADINSAFEREPWQRPRHNAGGF
jgi:hypothetical protein